MAEFLGRDTSVSHHPGIHHPGVCLGPEKVCCNKLKDGKFIIVFLQTS
jgi:hypothetical protein